MHLCSRFVSQRKIIPKAALVIRLLIAGFVSQAAEKNYSAMYSGSPWFDDKQNVVSAHGANIIKYSGRYYLFGERRTDTKMLVSASIVIRLPIYITGLC